MNFSGWADVSWREMLIVVVVLLLLYILVSILHLLRLRHLKLQNVGGTVGEATASTPVAEASLSPAPALSAYENAPDDDELAPEQDPEKPSFPWNEAPPPPPAQEQIDALEREITQLRRDVGNVRGEMQAWREEQRRERTQMQSIQNVSPLYNEAMQMALQGVDAAQIAQRCAIARAEADLVVALVRNQDDTAAVQEEK